MRGQLIINKTAYSHSSHGGESSAHSIYFIYTVFIGIISFRFRYDIHLTKSCKFGINKGFGIGIGMGIFQVTTLGNYAFSLW
jgi:hypothetical protein